VTLLPTALALLACAAVIYLACEYFVNGIEWVGLRFGVTQSAVGTVLAAFGTALPESVVTFVAVATGGSAQQKQIGVGAAIGGPLVLGTIAYAVVGLSYLAFHGAQKAPLLNRGEQRRLARDQAWFLLIFAAKVGLGLVAFRYKPWLGWAFVGGYALYTWREITAGEELGKAEVELEPLKLRPADPDPPAHWALLQTLLALALIFLSSQLFVRVLALLSPQLGISTQLTALLLAPIATELPETLNAIIWLRQGKTTLALGNISGAMMIQATIPGALGIFFTPWLLDRALTIAAAVTLVSIALMWMLLRKGLLTARKLALFGGLYLVFAVLAATFRYPAF
jgi:cation:H+ antiporter